MINKVQLYIYVKLFPLRSMELLRDDIVLTEISKGRDFDSAGLLKDLREILIREANRSTALTNYDEIELLLQKQHPYLFYSNAKKLTYEKYYCACLEIVDDLTTSFISIRDGNIVYKYWNNHKDENLFGINDNSIKVQIISYLIRFIPIDILIVNFLVKNESCSISQLEGVYSNLNMSDSLLDKVLLKGVAENHMHMGSAFNFSTSWMFMMNCLLSEGTSEYIGSLKNFFGSDDEEFLYEACLIRLLLCSFLSKLTKENEDFKNYLGEIINNGKLTMSMHKRLLDRKNSIRQGFLNYKDLCREILSLTGAMYDSTAKDVVFEIFKDVKHLKTTGENIFLYKALKYMKSSHDDIFKCLFINYTRIKNNMYGKIVQNNGIKGLAAFKEFYANASASIAYSGEEYWKELFRTNFQNGFLKKLEGRISIKDRESAFRKDVSKILKSYKEVVENDLNAQNKPFPRFGLVFHFLKAKEYEPNQKCWKSFIEVRETTHRYISFKRLQNKYKEQLDYLLNIRKSNPYLSEFLLGIDAASGENDTPVSVFAPIFSRARDGSNDVLYSYDNGIKVPQKSLMFTFHAGEDFRHILSGLRRIDEVIEHCKFHAGDRIGHGIALACDVENWRERNLITIIPRLEYLENLLWVWGVYSKNNEYATEVSIYLERNILKYAEEIYNKLHGITVSMLYDSYLDSFNDFEVSFGTQNDIVDDSNQSEKIFCIKESSINTKMWSKEKLTHAKNCICYLKKMNEPIFVEISDIDVMIIKQVQKMVMTNLARKGVVVELNPTSNLVIGEIDNIVNHHAFILQNIDFSNSEERVIVNVNSDNPTVFSNNISNELALLYYSLGTKGVSKDSALEWVDKVRGAGMSTSFISDKLTDTQYLDYLDKAIKILGE